jgi:hypothetical protein
MDSNSNMVISAARALYLRGNNTIRMTIATNVALNCMLLMGTNRISDLAPPQVDSDATNKKYVDTNSWSVRGNPLESETIDNTRVIGTLGEENFSIIRNNRTMFTFDGEGVRTSQTFIFDTNEGPLGSIYMDSNSNMVLSAARTLRLLSNNTPKITLVLILCFLIVVYIWIRIELKP